MSRIDSRSRSDVGRMTRADGAESTRPFRRPPTIRTGSGLSRRPARAAARAPGRPPGRRPTVPGTPGWARSPTFIAAFVLRPAGVALTRRNFARGGGRIPSRSRGRAFGTLAASLAGGAIEAAIARPARLEFGSGRAVAPRAVARLAPAQLICPPPALARFEAKLRTSPAS